MRVTLVPFDAGELSECRCRQMNRIGGQMRVGYMPLFTVNKQFTVQGATSAVFYDITGAPAAGRFTDQAQVNMFALLYKVIDDFHCTVDSRAFFITGNQKPDRALVIRVCRDKGFAGGHHGGQRTFHVRCSTPV